MIYRPLRYEQMMRAAEAYDVRARRMFGGMGIYTGEKMFAFLLGDDIGLKLGPEDQQQAMTLPGAGPMRTASVRPILRVPAPPRACPTSSSPGPRIRRTSTPA